ncbi:MAG: hypothetical protein IT492_24260, partial [Gammaproteobacteria bacterium]|nr:hypothetical protein [Gammaproteobacteria bacterium]
AKLQRTRAHVKRQGNIEYAREVNLPFYDPDPARVLPSHVVGASIRLAQVAELGQDGQVVNRLIRDIAVNGGNADWTRRAVDTIIGFANDADEQADKVSRFLRALQGFKLGLAVIPNATQTLNTLLLTDMPSVAKGIRAALTTSGQHFAIETGATLDPVLHETVRELATGSRHLEKFLKATGFSTVERFNRVVAANAGAAYTLRQLRALKADPKNLRARRKLAELGIDVDRAMVRGKISGDELLIASKRLVDASQFRARPQDLPEFASDPWGKVFFQFKSFAYQQTRLVKKALVDEIRDREFGRGLRNLAILAVLFPLAGEGVRRLRAFLTGRKRDEEGLMRYLDDAAAVGSLGILWDLIEGSRRRKFVETAAGPSAGMAADVLQTVATKPTDAEAWKKLVYRHAPLGSIGRRIIEVAQ